MKLSKWIPYFNNGNFTFTNGTCLVDPPANFYLILSAVKLIGTISKLDSAHT